MPCDSRKDSPPTLRLLGIAADQLKHVFEMFTQIDRSLERSLSGLGIGLTLVKTLAEMHGGFVEARSDGPGQGSEFVVRLPIAVEDGPAGAPAQGDAIGDDNAPADSGCR